MATRGDIRPLERAMSSVLGSSRRDLRAALSGLDMANPDATRDALLEIYTPLVESYGDAAGAATAEWYEGMRADYTPGEYTAEVPEWLVRDQADSTARWAAGRLWGDDPASAFDLLEQSLTRFLEDASRDTVAANVKSDPLASGWYRIARPDGCDFCVMLHSRGAVYKRDTADFASHDNCRCSAAPSWDPGAPEVSAREYEASKRMGGLRARAADPSLSAREREAAQNQLDDHRARVRSYIESDPDRIEAIRSELV